MSSTTMHRVSDVSRAVALRGMGAEVMMTTAAAGQTRVSAEAAIATTMHRVSDVSRAVALCDVLECDPPVPL
jgi:hypothetical protein